MTETNKTLLSAAVRAKIDAWLQRYPEEHKRSGVLEALRYVQEERGWLNEEWMDAVADYLGMPRIAVYEVATFYSLYHLKPVGRHVISVCTNISCMLRGSEEVLAHLKKRLAVDVHGTTADGKCTLKEVECLGACVGAPMLQIGKKYYENLTPEKIDAILASLE
ncbi:MAG: NADH dehydrogenase [Gammaproteobacteria bacterium RIFCSPHIGHO2_12_FULL_41_20]|nr:MAG: NADH dehydrogenase [Gammaproteobacteria bacterium RIFCSPHIGHO2_12_FULL_41_20]